MRGMEDEKVVRIIAKHSRPTDVITDNLKKVMTHVPEALDYLYDTIGTRDKFGTFDPIVTMDRVKDMYLGASAGFFLEKPKVIRVSDSVIVEVKASNKKIHAFEAVLDASHNFWSGKNPPPVVFTQSWKTETKYSWVDQLFTEAWEKFVGKARTFEIGNMFFIVQEKVCQTVRMLLERWGGICIGMKWARGGAHEFAKQFGIKAGLETKKRLGDGDFSALDQTIHYVFLQLFYTLGGIYYNPKKPYYDVMMRVLEYCARQIAARIVHICARMWGLVIGKMPTGAWMTAHGNSFIVLLYFFLFCIMQSYEMSDVLKSYFQEQMLDKTVMARVYGDDHAQGQDRNYEIEAYIGEDQFAKWVSMYVGATIRDIRSDVPFVSPKSCMGHLETENLVMLKQYMVRNRNVEKGQPDYLPFRGWKDYAIHAVWGSTVKCRDVYDIMLSAVGHAYGTYGSNYPAWLWLKKLHQRAYQAVPDDEKSKTLGTLTSRISSVDHTKKMRQAAISIDEMVGAFPSYEKLEDKNVYDPVYHVSQRSDNLYD